MIVAEKTEILRAVNGIQGVTSSKTVPILACCQLKAAENGLVASGTDNSTFIVGKALLKSSDTFECAVNARKLADILVRCHDGEIRLDTTPKGLNISSGRSKFSLPIVNDVSLFESFPVLGETAAVRSRPFLNALRLAAFAAAKDAGRAHLANIKMLAREDQMCLIGTDGHRMSIIDSGCPYTGGSILLPLDAALEILRIFRDAPETMSISSDISTFGVQSPQFELQCLLSATQFPDWQAAEVSEFASTFVAEKEDLVKCVTRLMAAKTNSGVAVATISFLRDHVSLTASSVEATVEDECAGKLEGDENEVLLNVRYLSEVLSYCDDKQVTIRSNPAKTPVCFTSGILKHYISQLGR